MSSHKVLIVDDEINLRKLLSVVFTEEGYEVICAADGEEAINLFGKEAFDLVLMDIRMPKMDGLTTLKILKEANSEVPIILMTAYGGVDTAVEALKLGAFDYTVKPFDLDDLKLLVKKAFIKQQKRENIPLTEVELPNGYDKHEKMLTNSTNMMELFRNIARVSQTNSSVLVMGESGTGKELVAKAIHYHSKRESGPFIKVNCGALTESLLESTLFGHAKGAFTGAQSNQVGLFERANHGTLLLDEVGEMSPGLQVKLLRVLQEREFEPIGSSKTIKTDFRLIAATNRNMQEMMDQGLFRQDLFYRLNVMSLFLPSLRERPDDIMLLAHHFVQRFCAENGKDVLDFFIDTIEVLNNYSWPGNIRELSNAMERAVIMAAGALIYPEDLPEQIAQSKKQDSQVASVFANRKLANKNLKDSMKNFERELIENTLRENHGHREMTAKALGVCKRTLMYKLQEYGIDSD
ncbi:sigma 54-interacting transcriptional regulator [Iodobacter ciconiae]|uniref:Response regulator n=1 Tax=Iodobacter ciconiae TaxID=2496266 RepID=A0A3S8ZQ34_9NEIS|nr:sigma 54-interacting transcriptional regulator [Iodobacter ciconiae]AZN35577.1 response regulator [Iodobacter ciconiae]